MFTIKRTDSDDPDFVYLVRLLDAELAKIDGEEHAFYNQFNKIAKIKFVVLVYDGDSPVGCGAMKEVEQDAMEVKRMYTLEPFRGKGVASFVLAELEKWAAEMDYRRCVLETGIRQPDAIALYQKKGYSSIPNYGQYAGVSNSRCFQKML